MWTLEVIGIAPKWKLSRVYRAGVGSRRDSLSGDGDPIQQSHAVFLVHPLGEARLMLLDRMQAGVVQHEREPGGIGALGHAASPVPTTSSSS